MTRLLHKLYLFELVTMFSRSKTSSPIPLDRELATPGLLVRHINEGKLQVIIAASGHVRNHPIVNDQRLRLRT